ncbi:MAG: UDP-glucose/GDP-mannose dehydrogenase family protein, partial [Bacteroidaceae bacterium]|nr:UDP-glucose/GDP-mannose dehydrogenase family protein [Bacteroidaceae bacterium]
MVITVFGLGFVGLTTSLGFAEYGHTVYGVEISPERLATIQGGRLPFLEPGLDQALLRHQGSRFHAIGPDRLAEAVAQSDCVYYCVGTPYGQDGQADLTYLFSAIDQTLLVRPADRFQVLVVKSTIPPSTTSRKVIPYIQERGLAVGTDLGVANNPEFLREGHCWDDFIHADRIVLGVSDDRSAALLRQIYAGVPEPVYCVSLNTGEFIKYLSNTLLATLISYSNEMSVIADTIGGIDVAEAFRILHMDKRWGGATMASYVYPGCGYGGYCLPKDTNALYAVSRT